MFTEEYPYGDAEDGFDGYVKSEKDTDGYENNYPSYDDGYVAYG